MPDQNIWEDPNAPEPAYVGAVLDIEAAKKQFEPYKKKISIIKFQADQLAVTDDPTNEVAVAMAAQLKTLKKAINEKRVNLTKDAHTFKAGVDKFCRFFTGDLDNAIAALRKKISAYQVEQDRIAQEAARAEAARIEEERIRAEKEAAKARAAVEKAGLDPNMVEAPVVTNTATPAAKPRITRTAHGTAHLQKTWTFELEWFEEVPDDYKVLNEPAIRQAIKAGARKIPGLKIFRKASAVIR